MHIWCDFRRLFSTNQRWIVFGKSPDFLCIIFIVSMLIYHIIFYVLIQDESPLKTDVKNQIQMSQKFAQTQKHFKTVLWPKIHN